MFNPSWSLIVISFAIYLYIKMYMFSIYIVCMCKYVWVCFVMGFNNVWLLESIKTQLEM